MNLSSFNTTATADIISSIKEYKSLSAMDKLLISIHHSTHTCDRNGGGLMHGFVQQRRAHKARIVA